MISQIVAKTKHMPNKLYGCQILASWQIFSGPYTFLIFSEFLCPFDLGQILGLTKI
jgi:hypothetical protein